ncbi:hypothetical protein OH77DRAFT_1522082 [Trametes cingulata]|nr:hypothetical protein OH77DRAFT_1522082 [Trametes cingulata]
MPHHRLPSAGTCEVVPGTDELPCPQWGYGERPRLCGTHRKEYGRLTASYKEWSDKAEGLYENLNNMDWTDTALWTMADVEEAIGLAQRCVAALEREITEREEHHRRFFVELHDGHAAWIQRLRKKVGEVRDIAAQLRRCKDELVNEQERRADEERRAEERRKVKATPRYQTGYDWYGRAPTEYSPPYYDDYEDPPRRHTPPTPVRQICIARLEESGSGSPLRCTREAAWYKSHCAQHAYEYDDACEALGKSKDDFSELDLDIYCTRRGLDYGFIRSLTRVTEEIETATRYVATIDRIRLLEATVERLNGRVTGTGSEYYASQAEAAAHLKRRLEAKKLDLSASSIPRPTPVERKRDSPQGSAGPSSEEGVGLLTALADIVVGGVAAYAANWWRGARNESSK